MVQEINDIESVEHEKSEGIKNARPEADSSKKRPSSSFFATVVLVIVVVLVLVGLYLLQQLRDKQEGLGGELDKEGKQISQLSQQNTDFQTQLATLQAQLVSLETKISTSDSESERSLSDFSDRHNEKFEAMNFRFKESLSLIQRQLGKTRGDWLVADAEYLISVANQRLYLVGDVKTTIIALESADQRLRESGDPAVFKVREALVREISVLKDIQPPDIIGIFVKLRALLKKAEQLPVFLPHAGKKSSEETSDKAPGEIDDLDSVLDSALSDLKGLVVIRRTDKPMDALLLPEEVALIHKALQLKLEMARIALAEHNQEFYQANLSDARDWILKHFDAQANATKSVLAEIDELESTRIVVEYPDISRSLKLLSNITKLRVDVDKVQQKSSQKKDKVPDKEEVISGEEDEIADKKDTGAAL